MDILCPESVSKRIIVAKKLAQGQEAATQLKFLLQNPFEADGSLSSEELVTNVLRSFTEALSIVTSSSQPCDADGADQNNLLNSGENGSPVVASGNDPMSGDSNESGKKYSSRAKKGRRGCYKRRKSAQTRTIVSHTHNDNHAWRKYGQKEILNSEFPRSYFRCTHKYDQGCSATKQVQRTQENPDMFQTTYIGIHTCTPTPKATQLIKDYSTTWESFLLNFDPDSSSVPNEQDHHHHVISSPSLTIKQEYPKEDTPAATMPLKMECDNTDTVYCSCTDSQCLNMDFGVESVHFGSDFHFDESQLLQCFDKCA